MKTYDHENTCTRMSTGAFKNWIQTFNYMTSPEDLIYSMVTVVKNMELCT